MFYDSAVMLPAFLMIGRYLDARAKKRTSDSIRELIGLQPTGATAIEIDENIDCYWFDMGSCYLNLSRHDDAHNAYVKAFELNPHSGGIANPDIFLDFIKDLKAIDLFKKA